MPLNYSKWDALELSDDSDVEVHPNVDKKSFIRMKQRQIHEQRDDRKAKISHLQTEGPINATLLVRMNELLALSRTSGATGLRQRASNLQGQLKDQPAAKPGEVLSFETMEVNLLTQIFQAMQEKGLKGGKELDEGLEKELEGHLKRLGERETARKKELVKEEAESKKKITSEDVHDGFDVSHVDKTPSVAVAPTPLSKSGASKGKAKQKIEVLNPGTVASTSDTTLPEAPPTTEQDSDDEDDNSSDSDLPTLTSTALAFSKIAPDNYDLSFKAISADPALYTTEETTDALLVEAFNEEMKGNKKYAKGCVHQGLLLQYCRKLGKDGVVLFFRKIGGGDARAMSVFADDVTTTYNRISARCATIKSERENKEPEEQIQLVAQDPNTKITFEIPSGPPPENLTLEGEGSETMDVEKVREFLQKRWDAFESFPKGLQKALKSGQLDEVNRVLGKMSVEDAEEVVGVLDESGMMSFVEGGVRDMTAEGSKDPAETLAKDSTEALAAEVE